MGAKELRPLIRDDMAMRLELLARVDILNGQLERLNRGIAAARAAGEIFATLEKIMSKFDDELKRLADDVTEITEVVPALVTTIGELAGKFKANANDPAKITELADALESAKTTLAGAVASGTAAMTEPTAPADGAQPTDTTQPA